MALTSGTKLGPYEVVSLLGAGGMGEVYRARDTRLERDVAVKVLPTNLSSDPCLQERLEREAKAVSKLAHPHICTLHDIGHQDGVDFLVMELVEGETLEHRLIKGTLPPEQTLRFAAQIADALAKAHKMGITHVRRAQLVRKAEQMKLPTSTTSVQSKQGGANPRESPSHHSSLDWPIPAVRFSTLYSRPLRLIAGG